ncbi:MAG: hypothetical protein V7731_18770 [Amphritea sp.]
MPLQIEELHDQALEYPGVLITDNSGPQTLCIAELRLENRRFADSGGISEVASEYGFVPGFQDTLTGVAEISRYGNGTAAPFHLLDGLPEDWITEQQNDGRVVSVKASVVAGFIRQNCFYTREQAAKAVKIINLDA